MVSRLPLCKIHELKNYTWKGKEEGKVCFPNSLQAINFQGLQCYCVMVLELRFKNKCGTKTFLQRKQIAFLGIC